MGENEYIGNCSANYEKEQTLKAIENYLELCKNLWGIRNRKTNKFIFTGILDNRLLICDSEKTENATLMRNEEDMKSVYDILANDENFKKNYFVDKVKDEDYNHELIEPIWNEFA